MEDRFPNWELPLPVSAFRETSRLLFNSLDFIILIQLVSAFKFHLSVHNKTIKEFWFIKGSHEYISFILVWIYHVLKG